MTDWLTVVRGEAPLVVAMPHGGTDLPAPYDVGLKSAELARHDADWHIPKLYAFVEDIGATIVRTAISRSVIDVNRDPSGASLYPGQATTDLCPLTTFDGEPLYAAGAEPGPDDVAARRRQYFDPYHAALDAELERLRAEHPVVVLYDAHSIRSRVPRLFDGELPQFNIGTNGGQTCAPTLTAAVERVCGSDDRVTNGRFRGGWTTRHYGRPDTGVHAIQMELAMRGYCDEARSPPLWDEPRAAPMQATLRNVLAACIAFARGTA